MTTNQEMNVRVEKAFTALGTRTPTEQEYVNYLFPKEVKK